MVGGDNRSGAAQASRPGPDASAPTRPQTTAGAGEETVQRSVQALADAAFNTEAAERDLPVDASNWVSVSKEVTVSVDKGIVRLQYVKVVGRPNAEASIALEVAGFIVAALFAGSVLRKLTGSPHDKLQLVTYVCHLGLDELVKVAIRR